MKHVLAVLDAELHRLADEKDRVEKSSARWRASERAMALGKLSTQRQEVVEAIQILRKVGADT